MKLLIGIVLGCILSCVEQRNFDPKPIGDCRYTQDPCEPCIFGYDGRIVTFTCRNTRSRPVGNGLLPDKNLCSCGCKVCLCDTGEELIDSRRIIRKVD